VDVNLYVQLRQKISKALCM